MNRNKEVVNFTIDNAPSSQAAKKVHQDDISFDFQTLLKHSSDDPIQEDFSFSNKAVKKAGRSLRKKEGDLKLATAMIQTFRAAHEKPLNAVSALIETCCLELNIDVRPVKRLKRLETIIDKLQRKTLNGKDANATCVSNMNDIGGCRGIFRNMDDLNLVKKCLIARNPNEKGICVKDIDDYINEKKQSDCGYRSLHIIYQCSHEKKTFKIEAQLRTKLQHLWATTVEIVDILEGTKIKTHSHSDDSEKSEKQIFWEELLSIMSDFIAEAEGIIELPNLQKELYVSRLKKLNTDLNALQRLTSFKMASEIIDTKVTSTGHVLLIVNSKTLDVLVQKVFPQQDHAISAYNDVETFVASIDGLSALLVSTQNLDQLSEAYPNYIGDCASFIEILRDKMSGFSAV